MSRGFSRGYLFSECFFAGFFVGFFMFGSMEKALLDLSFVSSHRLFLAILYIHISVQRVEDNAFKFYLTVTWEEVYLRKDYA